MAVGRAGAAASGRTSAAAKNHVAAAGEARSTAAQPSEDDVEQLRRSAAPWSTSLTTVCPAALAVKSQLVTISAVKADAIFWPEIFHEIFHEIFKKWSSKNFNHFTNFS